jgi:hypothetical protein
LKRIDLFWPPKKSKIFWSDLICKQGMKWYIIHWLTVDRLYVSSTELGCVLPWRKHLWTSVNSFIHIGLTPSRSFSFFLARIWYSSALWPVGWIQYNSLCHKIHVHINVTTLYIEVWFWVSTSHVNEMPSHSFIEKVLSAWTKVHVGNCKS